MAIVEKKQTGFTVVELLIVIVVIGILAAISIVVYNGIQQRARDTQRKNDVAIISKALELYYIDNGQYPAGSGSTSINGSWSTTADASWPNLANQLVPKYITVMPRDPISTQEPAAMFFWNNANDYDYGYYSGPNYCGTSTTNQAYIFVFKTEASAQQNTLSGNCLTNQGSLYTASNNRISKQ